MNKIAIINKCINCQNCKKYHYLDIYACKAKEKVIDDAFDIPNWCPLEDADNTKAKDENPKTVILNGLEWMTENLTGHGGTEIDGNWYYTYNEAMKAAEEVGDGWRLPTQDEFNALCELGSTWNEKMRGRWFGDKLFLEANGWISALYNEINDIGLYGYYWNSSPSFSPRSCAGCLHFCLSNFCLSNMYQFVRIHRNHGLSVRLVRDIK